MKTENSDHFGKLFVNVALILPISRNYTEELQLEVIANDDVQDVKNQVL